MRGDTEILLGVDEAGRGPLIGPMVIVGLAIEERWLEDLAGLGVRDSKRLTRSRREKLLGDIIERASSVIAVMISPIDIDRGNVNEIEVEAIERILESVVRIHNQCPKTYIDLFTTEKHLSRLKGICSDIVAEHGADSKYAVVAAASIIAKVLRDWHIDGLRRAIGDFGSGYPSDPKTKAWISSTVSEDIVNLTESPFIRHKWATVRRLERHANTLDRYITSG